ncbi:MAG TPA: DUF3857 domain-containing protein [Candidatus Acidoferrum sp.]|nr:DUF3857 domain-containing protein [Candidatus Acidoferrum sp.]
MLCAATLAQEPAAKPPDKTKSGDTAAAPKPEDKPVLPFQIQLLETHIRFETNGDSRKDVHTIVRINDPAGARQFSRLGFDYNRAFQQVEIPLVKVTHANGGTSEILPSAITDAPNPAVQNFPAYHDVRVKSVRILGLQGGDTLEYRVITTTTKHPLAPDFWLVHTFDRSGQVDQEIYELNLPTSRKVQPRINTKTPATRMETSGEGDASRTIYRWERQESHVDSQSAASPIAPDIAFNTLFYPASAWEAVPARWANLIYPNRPASREIEEKTASLTATAKNSEARLEAIYNFVAKKVETVALPLGATGYRTRPSEDILTSGYATQEDKAALFAALARSARFEPLVYLTLPEGGDLISSTFQHILVGVYDPNLYGKWMDPSNDVAPFGMIPSIYRGKTAFCPTSFNFQPGMMVISLLPTVPEQLPFSASQVVQVDATLDHDGRLSAKVNYRMRGDNELLLREAFHQAPKDKWKELAGLLALSDGFRGTITNATASDPVATKDPFTVEYEITQPKFVDWSKKPVRIPALLPQIALPDAPAKDAAKIELGTPLDVQTTLTLKLPEGTTVQTPAATSVTRDYATFVSKYDGHLNTVTVSRHINFVMREIPTERATDYNAFLRAVQNDQAQMLVFSPPPAASTTTP